MGLKLQIGAVIWAVWTLACLTLFIARPQINWELIGMVVLGFTFALGAIALVALALHGFITWIKDLGKESW